MRFHFNYPPSPPSWSPLASELELALGKWKTIRVQIGALPLPATHKWKGKCRVLLQGRSLAVSEQQLADGCEAEMIHADSTVPVSVPWKID